MDVDNFELEESLLLDPTKWKNKGKCGWRKDIDVEFYDDSYEDNDSVVEVENDDNYVAESEDDADNVVVVYDVDIEYDSSEEEVVIVLELKFWLMLMTHRWVDLGTQVGTEGS